MTKRELSIFYSFVEALRYEIRANNQYNGLGERSADRKRADEYMRLAKAGIEIVEKK